MVLLSPSCRCLCAVGRLTDVLSVQLEQLSITGEQSNDNWHVGLDCIPDEWAALTSLTKLELRGHSLLNVSCLPANPAPTLLTPDTPKYMMHPTPTHCCSQIDCNASIVMADQTHWHNGQTEQTGRG